VFTIFQATEQLQSTEWHLEDRPYFHLFPGAILLGMTVSLQEIKFSEEKDILGYYLIAITMWLLVSKK
jgi:hypothetical protein